MSLLAQLSTPKLLSPRTWRILGLSVAAGYTGLGLLDIFNPVASAQGLGIFPSKPNQNPEANRLASAATVLIGARDLSIGVALFAFDYLGMPRSMGVVVLSGLVTCAVDVMWIWRAQGRGWGVAFLAGASLWGWIGVNLLEM